MPLDNFFDVPEPTAKELQARKEHEDLVKAEMARLKKAGRTKKKEQAEKKLRQRAIESLTDGGTRKSTKDRP